MEQSVGSAAAENLHMKPDESKSLKKKVRLTLMYYTNFTFFMEAPDKIWDDMQ